MGLGQHDDAQGPHSFRGDVHGGLPVERRQNCVLDVAKGSTGQLDSDKKSETDETLLPMPKFRQPDSSALLKLSQLSKFMYTFHLLGLRYWVFLMSEICPN